MTRSVTDRRRHLAMSGVLMIAVLASLLTAACRAEPEVVTVLTADDFRHGTYIIDRPGSYRLGEDISFNPNSPASLDEALADGTIPGEMAARLGLAAPVPAHRAGAPLPTQYVDATSAKPESFRPAGPMEARYDPSAYGLGFFAAIAITVDGVDLDLAGHTIEQSEEHALLQRFFAVIELADQPFVPSQGPSDFGGELTPASDVTIRNGTIGRSAHHGIHGNSNADIRVEDVAFADYEVAAIALNGVQGLVVEDVAATNRKDVPVLGTFSSAQFIKPYVQDLVRTGSEVTLEVDGTTLTAADILAELTIAIDNTHQDLIVDRNVVDGRPRIDPAVHPDEYALFDNRWGVVDGNSYSFLINRLGAAVDGFPSAPEPDGPPPATDIVFRNVEVVDQWGVVNEIVAVEVDGMAMIDPVGAVFQIHNAHPVTGAPVTVSSWDASGALYLGNPVANAQALVAKAAAEGDVGSGRLDLSRLNFSDAALAWVEGAGPLADAGLSYVCNGDSMFHVDKGVIGFKIDAAAGVRMVDTAVDGLVNLGAEGSMACGDYGDGLSHPKATLQGYGGAAVRGYTFAGSRDVIVEDSRASSLDAAFGEAAGFAVLTDSSDVRFSSVAATAITAGSELAGPAESPGRPPVATAFSVSAEATGVELESSCVGALHSPVATEPLVGPALGERSLASC